MKGKTKKIVLAVAVIGAIAAGGVAFTAANTVPDSVAGYGNADGQRRDCHRRQLHACQHDGTHITARRRHFTTDHQRGKHVPLRLQRCRAATPDCTALTDIVGAATDRRRTRASRDGHRRRDSFNVAVTVTTH